MIRLKKIFDWIKNNYDAFGCIFLLSLMIVSSVGMFICFKLFGSSSFGYMFFFSILFISSFTFYASGLLSALLKCFL